MVKEKTIVYDQPTGKFTYSGKSWTEEDGISPFVGKKFVIKLEPEHKKYYRGEHDDRELEVFSTRVRRRAEKFNLEDAVQTLCRMHSEGFPNARVEDLQGKSLSVKIRHSQGYFANPHFNV